MNECLWPKVNVKQYEIKPFLLRYSSFSVAEEQDHAIKTPNVKEMIHAGTQMVFKRKKWITTAFIIIRVWDERRKI